MEPLSVQEKLVSTIMPLEAVCMCVYMIFVHMFIMQTETNRYIGICIKYIYIYIHTYVCWFMFFTKSCCKFRTPSSVSVQADGLALWMML